MGIRLTIIGSILTTALCGFAQAQTGPVVVVPGKPGVPVIINGVEVNGAVVYGDWGLARPGHGRIIIDGSVMLGDAPALWRGYYPIEGRAPRYGRVEIVPPHRPRPAADYRRAWGIESAPHPATEYPPFDPPPVIVAPRRDR